MFCGAVPSPNAASRMTSLYCPRCKFEVAVPVLDTPARSALAEQVRSGEKIEAIQAIREHQPDLTQAKAITNHVTGAGGRCVRCSHSFEESGEHYCPQCEALNLNW